MLSKLAAHWDGWGSMEGRHLVFAYVFVALIQGGYFLWILLAWRRLNAARSSSPLLRGAQKKAARPV